MGKSLKFRLSHGFSLSGRQRWRLHQQSPNCHWCGVLTRFIDDGPLNVPHDMATLDHLVTRKQGRLPGQVVPKVIACYSCNGSRGDGLNEQEWKRFLAKRIAHVGTLPGTIVPISSRDQVQVVLLPR